MTDWKGNVLEQTDVQKSELTGERVLNPNITFLISHILLDNNARAPAFGTSSFLNVTGHPEVSVKTGTTNDRRDNWTIGYTADAVVVTWVGNNDNTPMSGAVSGVSGASPIWNKVMKIVLDNMKSHTFPKQPDGVVGASICSNTGGIPGTDPSSPGCPTRFEYFLSGTVPGSTLITNQDIFVFNDTKQQSPPDADPTQIHTENHPVYSDPDGTLYCLDCPVASASAVVRYPLSR